MAAFDKYTTNEPFFEFLESLSLNVKYNNIDDFPETYFNERGNTVKVPKTFQEAIIKYSEENDFDYEAYIKSKLLRNENFAQALIYCFKCLKDKESIQLSLIKNILEE